MAHFLNRLLLVKQFPKREIFIQLRPVLEILHLAVILKHFLFVLFCHLPIAFNLIFFSSACDFLSAPHKPTNYWKYHVIHTSNINFFHQSPIYPFIIHQTMQSINNWHSLNAFAIEKMRATLARTQTSFATIQTTLRLWQRSSQFPTRIHRGGCTADARWWVSNSIVVSIGVDTKFSFNYLF